MKCVARNVLALFTVLCASPAPGNQQVDWLKAHFSAIKNIDPADEDFSDLTPFQDAIGKSQVVHLGEEHDDGSTFLLKTRFVKFLHEKMGFEVLAWEADLYDCGHAWKDLKAGKNGRASAKLCIDPLWTDSVQA